MTATTSLEELTKSAGEAALREAQSFENHSKLFESCKEKKNAIHRLEWDGVQVGKLLGDGSFSSVHEVTVPRVDNEKPSHDRNGQLVIKTLRKDCLEEPFDHGAIDLVLEAKILQCLHHEHIVKLHGVTNASLCSGDISKYFLVLERLYGTLDETLWKWSQFHEKQMQLKKRGRSQQVHDPLMLYRRKHIALQIARGLEYLHSHNIIYRDVKPHNIGFKPNGDACIFDLGLARDLDYPSAGDTMESTTYRGGRLLTSCVGTLRYMSPENALGQPYGLSSDVYSFATLLWEICTLRVPHEGLNVNQVYTKIFEGNKRPSLKRSGGSLSVPLKELITAGWHVDPTSRPVMKQVCETLQTDLLNTVTPDEESSTMSTSLDASSRQAQQKDGKCLLGDIFKKARTSKCHNKPKQRRKRVKLSSITIRVN